VVLLDEIEKAHQDIHEIFYQVFDKGWMEDGEGRYIDFRNTLILMTANVGDEQILRMCEDPELMPEMATIEKELRGTLRTVFPAAFLGRVKTIPYYPLPPSLFMELIALKLSKVATRLRDRYQLELAWSAETLEWVRGKCNLIESGARVIDAVVNTEILGPLSAALLSDRNAFQDRLQLDIDPEGKLRFIHSQTEQVSETEMA
jgi:type VI secretion system protein VasG